ncbi:MAG: glycosyltransferase family 2 protein [Cellulomonas sp.]|uniref:glycosyltransferase family 2 protein n=1 Tax=Cellulomonas sp. TaxID=40001 RepID=UPI001855A628|nr:glycosyltransferase family 2 protein [Cellulomonas sp.]
MKIFGAATQQPSRAVLVEQRSSPWDPSQSRHRFDSKFFHQTGGNKLPTELTSVVVHYGPAEATVRVAESALAYSTYVVVVANDLMPRPSKLDSRILWVVPPRNLGFGAGFAWGATHRPASILLALNNDVIVGEDSVRACVEVFSDEHVGVVGPVLNHEDGSLQSGAGTVSAVLRRPHAHTRPGAGVSDCIWVTGAVMFIRASALNGVGMDGSYFLGEEDVDFCIRARAQGWHVRCVGTAPATHFGSRVITGPRWSYYATRNQVWLARSRYGLARGIATWIWEVGLLPRVFLADVVKRRDITSSRLVLKGLRDALRRKPSALEGPWANEPVPSALMKW